MWAKETDFLDRCDLNLEFFARKVTKVYNLSKKNISSTCSRRTV